MLSVIFDNIITAGMPCCQRRVFKRQMLPVPFLNYTGRIHWQSWDEGGEGIPVHRGLWQWIVSVRAHLEPGLPKINGSFEVLVLLCCRCGLHSWNQLKTNPWTFPSSHLDSFSSWTETVTKFLYFIVPLLCMQYMGNCKTLIQVIYLLCVPEKALRGRMVWFNTVQTSSL